MNYLYNGVELPQLPEWDKKKKPYATIVRTVYESGSIGYALVFSTEPSKHLGICLGCANISRYNYASATQTWKYIGEQDFIQFYLNVSSTGTSNGLWTNGDIIDPDDGTLYLPASYPINPETGEEIRIYDPNYIPVGSAPDIEPKLFMNGWDIGQFVRAML